MRRRDFVAGGAAAGVVAASDFPAPAIAQERREWRMVTAWPRNFPGLATGPDLIARLINEGADGRLTVTVYGAGEIVPAFEAIDAVQNGTVEMGHGASYYWKGKVPAAQFLTSVPFGLTAQEQNAWYRYGGGQELADEIYAQMGCVSFVSGNTGVQMAGWFNREIDTVEDFRGLKMRTPGLGGEVLKELGTNVVNLPGGEILTAMQSGAIDAMEWVGPYNDLAFGLFKVAKSYYYPGWQEPSGSLHTFINRAAWESLPQDLQALVRAANQAANIAVLDEFVARNDQALTTLVQKHGVELRVLSDEILKNLGRTSAEVINDLAAQDALSRKTYDSLLAFQKGATAWAKVSEQSYLQARALLDT